MGPSPAAAAAASPGLGCGVLKGTPLRGKACWEASRPRRLSFSKAEATASWAGPALWLWLSSRPLPHWLPASFQASTPIPEELPPEWCPCPRGVRCGRLQIVLRGAPVDSRACALSWSQSIRDFPGDRTLGLSQSPWPLPQAICVQGCPRSASCLPQDKEASWPPAMSPHKRLLGRRPSGRERPQGVCLFHGVLEAPGLAARADHGPAGPSHLPWGLEGGRDLGAPCC